MDWSTILKIGHIAGTVLGAGGATFAEIFSLKALKDGQVDPTESSFLRTTYAVIRIGIVLIVLSGFGYFLLFRLTGFEERLYNPRMWMKLILTVIIVVNAVLLQARKIPFVMGSALSFTSWYGALILGAWRSLHASYLTMTVWYVIAVVLVAFVLSGLKRVVLPRARSV